jgi:uncharacterized membrane-anchored protein
MNIPTDEECKNCEFNRSLRKSVRGMILVVAMGLLFAMWLIAAILEAKYGVRLDTTVMLGVAGAVIAGIYYYFDSQKKIDEAKIAIRQIEANK